MSQVMWAGPPGTERDLPESLWSPCSGANSLGPGYLFSRQDTASWYVPERGHPALSHQMEEGSQELSRTSWFWNFLMGDSGPHLLRRGFGCCGGAVCLALYRDGENATCSYPVGGANRNDGRRGASPLVLALTSCVLHSPRGAPRIRLTPETLISDFIWVLLPGAPSGRHEGGREREGAESQHPSHMGFYQGSQKPPSCPHLVL